LLLSVTSLLELKSDDVEDRTDIDWVAKVPAYLDENDRYHSHWLVRMPDYFYLDVPYKADYRLGHSPIRVDEDLWIYTAYHIAISCNDCMSAPEQHGWLSREAMENSRDSLNDEDMQVRSVEAWSTEDDREQLRITQIEPGSVFFIEAIRIGSATRGDCKFNYSGEDEVLLVGMVEPHLSFASVSDGYTMNCGVLFKVAEYGNHEAVFSANGYRIEILAETLRDPNAPVPEPIE
jgi:hypothetical protein